MSKLSYFTKLTGTTFEGRQGIISVMIGDEPLRVRREADNQYDPKAVAVDVQFGEVWTPIGYIAKDKNTDISESLDAGNEVTIKLASITGGEGKSYGVNIELEYTKAEKKVEAVKPKLTALELFQKLLGDSVAGQYDINISTTPARDIKKYRSVLIGKDLDIVEVDGHVRLANKEGYISGSKFPEKFYPEFDQKGILQGIVDKYDVDGDAVLGMWDLLGRSSTGLGNSVHYAMENYDRNFELGDKIKSVKVLKTKTNVGPNKALSKNPFLKHIVESFHAKFGGTYGRLNEQFIEFNSGDIKLCGSIDRVKIIDRDKKIIRIQDFKTDGDIHSKKYQKSDSPFKKEMGNTLLDLHWLQLSFYAYILKQYGWTVEGLDVYWVNPSKLVSGENPWEEFSSNVINVEKGL